MTIFADLWKIEGSGNRIGCGLGSCGKTWSLYRDDFRFVSRVDGGARWVLGSIHQFGRGLGKSDWLRNEPGMIASGAI